MGEIRVAIAGVGNCACSLVQGVHSCAPNALYNLMHGKVGDYGIKDIKFVAAFDIDARKVGRDLSEAIFTEPNCTTKHYSVPYLDIPVQKGPVLDGVGASLQKLIEVDKTPAANVTKVLKDVKADVLVNFLPTGARKATEHYAMSAVKAKVAFINCIPEPIASKPSWQTLFRQNKIPLLGDDIKSQLGATILHRTLLDLCKNRGVMVSGTYQHNIGGNADFLNMQDPERYLSKDISKTEALKSSLVKPSNIKVFHPSFASFLKDYKVSYIGINGKIYSGSPFSLHVLLSVEDSPNSAGVVIDAIRIAKIALDRGMGGSPPGIGYLFKKPPVELPDYLARVELIKFINQGEKIDIS